MFKDLKSIRFLVIALICYFVFAIPVFVLWIKDPNPTSWYLAGIIAVLFAGTANLKRFLDDNRRYKRK